LQPLIVVVQLAVSMNGGTRVGAYSSLPAVACGFWQWRN